MEPASYAARWIVRREGALDIGEPRKIIEIEPDTIPVPATMPMPDPASPAPSEPSEPVHAPDEPARS